MTIGTGMWRIGGGGPAISEGTREWVKNNWRLDYHKIIAEHYDAADRLHHESGPALVVGFLSDEIAEAPKEYFCWHGMAVPKFVIDEPETITVWAIEREQNAEIRRVMIERYLGKDDADGLDGYGRYIRDSRAEEIDRDKVGILWRKEMRNDEPLLMVEVLNSTPEPDGSIKRYFLRVPPDTRTATQGIAWTFGLKARDYKPAVET